MIAKVWKKLGLIILIFACLFNITAKLISKVPLLEELKNSAIYIFYEQHNKEKK